MGYIDLAMRRWEVLHALLHRGKVFHLTFPYFMTSGIQGLFNIMYCTISLHC